MSSLAPNTYVFGLDGGGTKMTGCLLRVDGELLAHGQAPPANYAKLRGGIALPIAQFLRSLQHQAKLPETEIQLAGICSTGVGRDDDRQALRQALHQAQLALKIVVESDFMAALTGAFAGEPGIVVIAGTGAVAYARTPNGNTVRVGGWGYLIGDEGGGFYLVRQALNAALQDWDGRGEKTGLRQIFERHFSAASIDLIISRVYDPQFDRGQMAALAPLVFDAAEQGDRVAQKLLDETGHELGRLAQATLQHFEGAKTVPLALLGNLFRRAELIMPSFWKVLQEKKESLCLVPPQFDAAIGAALLALLGDNGKRSPDFWAKLKNSYRRFQTLE